MSHIVHQQSCLPPCPRQRAGQPDFQEQPSAALAMQTVQTGRMLLQRGAWVAGRGSPLHGIGRAGRAAGPGAGWRLTHRTSHTAVDGLRGSSGGAWLCSQQPSTHPFSLLLAVGRCLDPRRTGAALVVKELRGTFFGGLSLQPSPHDRYTHTLVHTLHTQTHLCTGAHTHWYPRAHLYMRTHRPPCTEDPSPHTPSGFQDSLVGVARWVPGPPSSGVKAPHCPGRRSPTPCHKTFKGAVRDHKLVFHGSSGSPVSALCRRAKWALTP